MDEFEWTETDRIGMRAPVAAALIDEAMGQDLAIKDVLMIALKGLVQLEVDLREEIHYLRSKVDSQD